MKCFIHNYVKMGYTIKRESIHHSQYSHISATCCRMYPGKLTSYKAKGKCSRKLPMLHTRECKNLRLYSMVFMFQKAVLKQSL